MIVNLFRIWELTLALDWALGGAGRIAVVEQQPFRGRRAFRVFCAERDLLLRFAKEAGARKEAIAEVRKGGEGEPWDVVNVGGLRCGGCWSYFDERREAGRRYTERANV